MNMLTENERDRFASEVALAKGVDVDALLAMPAEKYSDLVKNADEMVKQAKREEYGQWNGQHCI